MFLIELTHCWKDRTVAMKVNLKSLVKNLQISPHEWKSQNMTMKNCISATTTANLKSSVLKTGAKSAISAMETIKVQWTSSWATREDFSLHRWSLMASKAYHQASQWLTTGIPRYLKWISQTKDLLGFRVDHWTEPTFWTTSTGIGVNMTMLEANTL